MLTQEEAARLRIKAKHGELTADEQAAYSEYMEQQAMAGSTGGAQQVPPQQPYGQQGAYAQQSYGQQNVYGQMPQSIQPQQMYVQPNPNDTGSFGWAVLGFFFPIVGLVLYLVWKTEKPLTARRAGKGALVAVIVYVALMLLMLILTVILAMSVGSSVSYYSSMYDTILMGM